MPSQSSSTEHVRRRASAAAAAEASEIRPINAKKAGKRPARPAKEDRASAPASSGTAAAESNDTLPTFDTAAEGLPITAGKASKPPTVPPGPLPRNERGEPSLLQERAGIDADENYGSQEYALSSYLKLHPVLSLESTSCQTLQLVADLVADASIPTKELEIVPKPHDDEYLRYKLPRLNPPHPDLGVPGGHASLRSPLRGLVPKSAIGRAWLPPCVQL